MSESYIVRIYRRSEEDPNTIAGLVEVVATGEVKQFSNSRGLSDLLCRVENRKWNSRRTHGEQQMAPHTLKTGKPGRRATR